MPTANEVLAAASNEQRALNSSRFVPTMPGIVRRVSVENRVYIFNVGPWAHVRELGSTGTFRIPACPEGEEYSTPLAIDAICEEPYPKDEASCVTLPPCGEPGQLTGQGSGLLLAKQIIGDGPFIAKRASFVPYGVFISPKPIPPKTLLAAANVELRKRHLAHIEEARRAFIKDPTNSWGIIQAEWHFVSADALKLSPAECPWRGQVVAAGGRANCPGCGDAYNVGILRHSCGWFFDKAKWEANQAGK